MRKTENILTYSSPADCWSNALPIGNGRLGGMVWGQASGRETVNLNEDSLWHGRYQDRNSEAARENLDKIRKLLSEEKIPEAEALAETTMSSAPKYFGAYEPLGNFITDWRTGGGVSNYKRILDLEKAVLTVSFDLDGVHIKKRYFASHIDDSIIITVEADKNIPDFSCNLMRRPADEKTYKIDGRTVGMSSSCGDGGVKFSCAARGTGDGNIKTVNDYICFSGCKKAIIRITAYSDYCCKNPFEKCLENLEKTDKLSSEELILRHTEEYGKYYKRTELNLGAGKNEADTDKRLGNIKAGAEDDGMIELYFNFGRYLMISSSYPGTQAMNLQGIWNDSFTPAWECNYTININTEMNYWPAESCNLSEFHEPLFDLIYKMLPHGRETARRVYGCRGFTAHHCTNLWGDTAIEGNWFPSPIWPMGGAWLALHMAEHYEYTQDREFLEKKAYPVLKEAALFFIDYMVKDSEGYLVTGPSISPENSYITDSGTKGSLCMGPYMDMEIVTELYKSVIKYSEILDTDRDIAARLKDDLKQIRPLSINSEGCLMEWQKDYKETEPGHRHMSHLFALFPGDGIDTPELMNACRNTLERRLEYGGGHTGWSSAWIVNFYAALSDGENCRKQLYKLLRKSTYSSLLDVHPPFQIDGNMGGTAGIANMLLMCRGGKIKLLPALPEKWKTGSVKGLKAKGGFTFDIYWKDGGIYKTDIYSAAGNDAKIVLPYKADIKINSRNFTASEFTVKTEKGKTAHIDFT